MALPLHATTGERVWHYTFLTICVLIFCFLIIPILVILPLSFNAQPYFTFTPEMLSFDPAGYSTKWYEAFFNDSNWQAAVKNSLIIAVFSTIISVSLGTLAALGLSQKDFPFKTTIMGILISPMVVPLIISAAGMFFFYARVNLLGTHIGVILAHAALATPFVVIVVTATLTGFDHSLTRAAANLGSSPTNTFFKITVPLITPGVISGALFAFITSFDEVVVVLFLGSVNQRTIPWAMFSGIREEISPTILAVATLLITFSIILLCTVELLRRRGERLRGITPH
ncbi:MAG: putative spermidine/putrescine transport system permease protein [Cocleimonas sp.]|jgi:putative spermidine/putrescine transport system permease protein